MLAEPPETLDAAYEAHPERFPNGRPRAGSLPDKVWINEPAVAVQADPMTHRTGAGGAAPCQPAERAAGVKGGRAAVGASGAAHP